MCSIMDQNHHIKNPVPVMLQLVTQLKVASCLSNVSTPQRKPYCDNQQTYWSLQIELKNVDISALNTKTEGNKITKIRMQGFRV